VNDVLASTTCESGCCESGQSGGIGRELMQVRSVQQEPTSVAPMNGNLGGGALQHGVGLVFRTTRDGKMVVSSFVKDSSAYDCGLVRDGGGHPLPLLT
jgi:hypothetical protein